MNKIRFECYRCGATLGVSKNKAGKWIICVCGKDILVPLSSTIGEQKDSLIGILIGRTVYGFGAALMVSLFLLILLIFIPFGKRFLVIHIFPYIAGFCFLLGLILGERFILWLGRHIDI